MPKARATLPLMLPPRAPGTTAHGWLAAALRAEILAGRLSRGTRLPSTRDLATQYRLARGTVVGVIAGLKTEGYVHGRVGSGTYVSVVLPDDLLYTGARAGRPPTKAPSRRVSAFARRVQLFPSAESRPMRAFRANVPDVALFQRDYGHGSQAGGCAGRARVNCSIATRSATVRCARRSPTT